METSNTNKLVLDIDSSFQEDYKDCSLIIAKYKKNKSVPICIINKEGEENEILDEKIYELYKKSEKSVIPYVLQEKTIYKEEIIYEWETIHVQEYETKIIKPITRIKEIKKQKPQEIEFYTLSVKSIEEIEGNFRENGIEYAIYCGNFYNIEEARKILKMNIIGFFEQFLEYDEPELERELNIEVKSIKEKNEVLKALEKKFKLEEYRKNYIEFYSEKLDIEIPDIKTIYYESIVQKFFLNEYSRISELKTQLNDEEKNELIEECEFILPYANNELSCERNFAYIAVACLTDTTKDKIIEMTKNLKNVWAKRKIYKEIYTPIIDDFVSQNKISDIEKRKINFCISQNFFTAINSIKHSLTLEKKEEIDKKNNTETMNKIANTIVTLVTVFEKNKKFSENDEENKIILQACCSLDSTEQKIIQNILSKEQSFSKQLEKNKSKIFETLNIPQPQPQPQIGRTGE